MKVVDSGHKYELAELDGGGVAILQFVKRDAPAGKYPGNIGSYPGTTMQEVFRACIDRCKYVNSQIPSGHTRIVIKHLRSAILQLEMRAADRHGRQLILPRVDIENEPTCELCGHIQCEGNCRKERP